MTRCVWFANALVVVALASPAAAQENLTLDRAVRAALAQNASLRAAQSAAAEAAARVGGARAGWFPRISVAESWQRSDQPVFVFSSLLASRQFAPSNFAIDSLNHPDATSFFQTSLGIQQLVFDGGLQRSVTDGATLRQEMANRTVDEAAASLAVAVTQTFGRVLTAEASGRAAVFAFDAAREDHARAVRRRDAGRATDADVLALAAHVANLQQRVIQSGGEAAVARAELNRLMGVRVDREYLVTEPPAIADAVDSNTPLETLFAEAERARPEVLRATAAQRLAEADHSSASASLIPQIAAQAGLDVSGTQFADRTSAWAIGASVRWNLSLGGAERAQMRAATEAAARARAEAEDARAAVHVEVVTALRRLEAARARQAAGLAAVDQAGESQRIIRDRFDAGVAGVTDVLRASSAVMDAGAQRTSATVDAIVSGAMLRRALGRHP